MYRGNCSFTPTYVKSKPIHVLFFVDPSQVMYCCVLSQQLIFFRARLYGFMQKLSHLTDVSRLHRGGIYEIDRLSVSCMDSS
jgi:hypothetical protein